MAQLMSVRLSRVDASPWGFRLQGGKDFGQPLIVQKVNANSPAERAGLIPGDSLIKINNVELVDMTHKDAQSAIVKAGNSFELTIQRGGLTWKPSVVPVGPMPTPNNTGSLPSVTKTSLAYKPQAPLPSFSQYNYAPKPFGGSQMNGLADKTQNAKNLASKVYNSPIGLYSDQTIAETLSAQAEVLAGGVIGVNFKKNEKSYNAANSEVLKMVQEIDAEPREPEPAIVSPSTPTTPKPSSVPGVRPVSAPETKPQPAQDQKVLPPGQNICADCERLIVGLFVRIKDKNLHVDCFKCATCGTSLKNVGYYNINNKLYCDIHAKMVARQNPPAPNLEPLIVPPGTKTPASIISSSIGAVPTPYQSQFSVSSTGSASPQPTSAPLPFQSSTPAQPKFNVPQLAAPSSFTRPQSVETNKKEIDPDVVLKVSALSLDHDNLPKCWKCNSRGPFITALGKIWCPDHFVCSNAQCGRPLADIGFVEEKSQLYCEFCFEKYLAPNCDKCGSKIKGDCLNAIGKHFHPECFACVYCGVLFGNNPFFMEDGMPYCQKDWNELFTTKCFSCGFPIEAGDKWLEALNNSYHSQCFNCTTCKSNLEGQTFFAKGGRAFCKSHAR